MAELTIERRSGDKWAPVFVLTDFEAAPGDEYRVEVGTEAQVPAQPPAPPLLDRAAVFGRVWGLLLSAESVAQTSAEWGAELRRQAMALMTLHREAYDLVAGR